MDGCSVQYAENSVREVVPRMKGGAVKDERSPLKDAIDYKVDTYQRICKAPFRGRRVLSERKTRSLYFEVQCPHLRILKS